MDDSVSQQDAHVRRYAYHILWERRDEQASWVIEIFKIVHGIADSDLLWPFYPTGMLGQ